MRVFDNVGIQSLVKFTVLLCLAMPAFGQDAKDNLYSRGLKACLEKEVASYEKFSSRDLRNVIVVKDDTVTYGLPSQFGEIKVEYLTLYELGQRYIARSKKAGSEARAEIPVIEISAIFDEGEKLFFAYRNSWFSYRHKGGFLQKKRFTYGLAYEGGCRAEIRFDQGSKRYFIEKTELWGI